MLLTKSNHPVYNIHPSVEYAQAVIRNLPDKTGYSVDKWMKILEESGYNTVKDRKEWLKSEFGVGGTTANIIAHYSLGEGTELYDPVAYLNRAPKYVDDLYSGDKSHLRSIHDAIIDIILTFGNEVRICPVKTMVSIYRNNVFAQIKPTAKTRIDLGICLKKWNQRLPDWIISTGGIKKGDRITHRIALNSLNEIDKEVRSWLKIAFDLDK